MTRSRVDHALAQFDARYTLPFWKTGDEVVNLPWYLAAVGAPLVIGTRILVWAGAIPLQALRNYLSWREPADQPGPTSTPFVLVLRTFGNDGGMLLPPIADANVAFPRARTLEQLVGDIASKRELSLVGFADHAVTQVPPGVRYHRAENDEWWPLFQQQVEAASAVLVMPTPGRALGPSFRDELAFVRLHGHRDKTVVLAPPDLDAATRAATNEVYQALGFPQTRAGHLVAWSSAGGRVNVVPALGSGERTLASRYDTHLARALDSVLA